MSTTHTPYNSPASSNSSLSSSGSNIIYNVNFSNNVSATYTTRPLILYTCKFCENNINKNMNIYRGYNHSFCSNYCRSNYSQKIALLDYYLNNYDLWL
jgi:hypothetical protein